MEPLLAPAAAPVPLLPEPARSAGLAALAPAVRAVAARPGPPDLLGAYQVGAAFNWILDQRLHQLDGALRPPAARLCELCGVAPRWKNATLYDWGRIARHLEEPWVREANGRVTPEGAEVIVRSLRRGGRRPAAPWIRRLLLQRAAEAALPVAALRRVHDALCALEQTGADPAEAMVRARIAAALGCGDEPGLTSPAGPAPPRSPQGALAALAQRLEAAGRDVLRLPPLLVQADPADPALRQAAELLRMYARDLDLRLSEMLARFVAGAPDHRRLPREPTVPVDERSFHVDERSFHVDELAVPGDSEAKVQAPRAAAAAGHSDEPASHVDEPVFHVDEPALHADAPPPAQVPAPPPARGAPFVHHLPVPYPGADPDPSPAERHGCALIAAIAQLVRCSEDAIGRARAGEAVADRLALLVCRAAQALSCEIGEVRPDLAEGADAGAAQVAAALAADPALSRESLLPVPSAEGAAFVPLAYLPYEIVDPLGGPSGARGAAPSPAEQALFAALGLLSRVRIELGAFHSRLLDHHDPCCDLLVFQLREALRDASFNGNRLVNAFQSGAQAARAAEPDEAASRAAAAAARAAAEARLLVLGAARPPEQHATIGVLPDGRPVALPTGRGLSLVALGGTGRGKSHLGVLLIESLLLPLPGLCRLLRRGVPVVFSADWRKGFSRHQHLCALDANPDPAQWQWLRQHLHAELSAHLLCAPRVIALCLPGRRGAYEASYPDLLERGLQVREVRLHPEDWGSFGYGAMLGGLLDKGGRGRPQWAGCLEQSVAALGDRAEPLRVWRELERAGLGGRGRAAVRGVLERMAGLTSTGERLGDLLTEDALCVFLLEDEFLGPEVLLPLQAAIMNALTRAAPPDLPLLFVVEEVGKQGMNAEVQRYLEQLVREARHGLWSLFLGAHLSTDLPPATVTLATGVAQFGGTSEKDVRRLAELRPELASISPRALTEQPRGVATFGFAECTDPALWGRGQQVILRPSCLHAGGETREVGADVDAATAPQGTG